MLGLFGFIKKELAEEGKLSAKYREWKNVLYNYRSFDVCNLATLTNENEVCLFSPKNQKCPVDLNAKPWEFSCCVNVTKKGISSSSGTAYPQTALAVKSIRDAVYHLKCVNTIFQGLEFATNRGQAANWKEQCRFGSTQIGKNYIKLTYTPKTETTGVFTPYYSLNGSSWTAGTPWNYTKLDDDFSLDVVYIYSHAPEVKDASTVPVSSIRFVYDGEVIFGK